MTQCPPPSLRLALNLGQGWPPGGPWIADAHRTKHLTCKSHEVEGPTTFARTDLPTNGLAFAWQLAGPANTVATNSFQDLTRFIQRQGTRRGLRWEVPPGRWLVHENYFATVRQFLHERGLSHRPQIYGRGLTRDLLEAYTRADTPEVEQGDYCLPEAVWAARTTGKPVASCEAFTHLQLKMGRVRRPHGEPESNPSHLRGAANAIFGEGVNRIQMHSFSYNPPGVPLPGDPSRLS